MRPNNYENRPEYYDRGYGSYNGASGGASSTGYRGGYSTGNSYNDDRLFRPWDQTYRYVIRFFN